LAASLGGRSSIIHWVHSDGEIAVAAHSYFTPDYMDAYSRTYVEKDLWVHSALHPARRNQVFIPSDVVPATAWERSEIWNELVRPSGDDTFYCIGAAYHTAWGAGIVGVNRGRASGGFHEHAAAELNAQSETLRRVLMVRGEILAHRRRADLVHAGLDALDAPAIAVRGDQLILHANAAAEAMLRREDVLMIKLGVLRAQDEAGGRRLAAAVAAATEPFDPQISAFGVAGRGGGGRQGRTYQVTVTPLPCISGPPRAMILLRDPAAPDRTLTQRLKTLYRLTAAEAEIAVSLGAGEALPRIAEARGVALATLRSQLKAIMAKMQCSRQAEVAAIVAHLLPIRDPLPG
jgi:DNA-binding CsgD family transcriptional regulator